MPARTPNFDRVAHIYRWAEYLALGKLLEHTREHYLPQLLDRRRALVLGDGDGRFLAKLMQENNKIEALAIDTSATMLHLLRQSCRPYTNRLQTLQASAFEFDSLDCLHKTKLGFPEALDSGLIGHQEEEGTGSPRLQPGVSPDLIVTHFFLDCLTQPELNALARRLAAQTAPGTLWLLSDFALPHHRLLRPLAALYIRSLYLAFRILTGLRVTQLPDPPAALTLAGFTRTAHHNRLAGLLYTELWQHQ